MIENFDFQKIMFSDVNNELIEEWETLLEKSTVPSIYASYDYINTSIKHYVEEFHERIFLLTVRDKKSKGLIAIFPLIISDRKCYKKIAKVVEHAIGTHNTDVDKPYPIIRDDQEENAWTAFRYYFEKIEKDWDWIEYDELIPESYLYDSSKILFKPLKYFQRIHKGPVSPIVDLTGEWKVFWDGHRNLRKKYRRMINRLGDNYAYNIYTKPEDIDFCLDHYIATEEKGWKAGLGISDPLGQKFYRDLLKVLAKKNQVCFGILFDGETPVAVELNFIYGKTVYFAQGTFNPDYEKLSPGSVSTSKFIEHFFDKGYERGDFLAGYAHYVNPLASKVYPTKSVTIFNINSIFAYYVANYVYGRIKAFVKVKILRMKSRMQIKILKAEEISQISIEEWKRLAERSRFSNPFFEHWSLVPALKYFAKNKNIRVVCAYKYDQLFALFPIELHQHKLGFKYLSIWKHDQCFLCDPLCTSTEHLTIVITRILRKLNLIMMRIDDHSLFSYGRYIDQNSVIFEYTRGAVFDSDNIKRDLANLPRKVRMENKRIAKRFKNQTQATYVTSRNNPDIDWLEEYCQLEDSGWKKEVQGSILSDKDVHNYYKEMHMNAVKENQIEYQGYFNQDGALAIAMRVVSGTKAFDLKTSLNENYRKLYPGVNLELENLNDEIITEYEFVDSCTDPNNKMINRIWPAQRKIYSSIYFHKGFISKILKPIYRFKNRQYL